MDNRILIEGRSACECRLWPLQEAYASFSRLPNHPNELTFIKKQTEPEPAPTEQPTDDGSNADADKSGGDSVVNLRIVIICCLAFAGVIALFIAFKTKPPRRKQNYYDENDYE